MNTLVTGGGQALYYSLLGKTEAMIEKELMNIKNSHKSAYAFELINTRSSVIEAGFIYECNVKFKQGEVFEEKHKLFLNGNPVNFQFENVEYYREGSIRQCSIVMELPELKPEQNIYGEFKNHPQHNYSDWSIKDNIIETKSLSLNSFWYDTIIKKKGEGELCK